MQSKPSGCCIKGTVISKQCMWTTAVILQKSSVLMASGFIAQVQPLGTKHGLLGIYLLKGSMHSMCASVHILSLCVMCVTPSTSKAVSLATGKSFQEKKNKAHIQPVVKTNIPPCCATLIWLGVKIYNHQVRRETNGGSGGAVLYALA